MLEMKNPQFVWKILFGSHHAFIFIFQKTQNNFFYLKNASISYRNIQSHTALETKLGKINRTNFLSEAIDGNKWVQINTKQEFSVHFSFITR